MKKGYDIALCKLVEPVIMSETVSPACLPQEGDSTFPPGMHCLVSGWGKVGRGEDSISVDENRLPWKLRQATLPLIDNEMCSWSETIPIQDSMQCAGGEGRTSCNGDSGGPLVCYNEKDEKWYQVKDSKILDH